MLHPITELVEEDDRDTLKKIMGITDSISSILNGDTQIDLVQLVRDTADILRHLRERGLI